jgi:bacteriocin-like protein
MKEKKESKKRKQLDKDKLSKVSGGLRTVGGGGGSASPVAGGGAVSSPRQR